MPWIDSLDYLNLNSLRRYPLREGSSVTSTDGFFQIPDSLIVDFSISASSDIALRCYISRFFNKVSSVIIEISAFSGVNPSVIVGVFDIDLNSHKLNDTYYLTPSDDYVSASAKITLGDTSLLSQQPSGSYLFDQYSSEFETRTVVPSVVGVTRIKYIDSDGNTQSLSGDVVMQARSNMLFTYGAIANTVIMDVGDNLGLNKSCDTGNCIKRINGVVPEPTSGNLSLIGIDCLRVASNAGYTLELTDSCCTPCSGCNDLTTLTTRLTSLENKFIELKNFYTTINGQLVNYLTTVNSNCACP